MKPQEIISCIDLTSLNATDTSESIINLCQKATGPLGAVAAICCYPQFLPVARRVLPTHIPLATVVNFPHGQSSLPQVEAEVRAALLAGADEIDLVIPYQQAATDNFYSSVEMTWLAKNLCMDRPLKVIIESGELKDPQLITSLSEELLAHGADFIKTSTGKASAGANPEAVNAILTALQQHYVRTYELKGLKVSGGIKTIAQAELYMGLAESVFGKSYLRPQSFRIGASRLLDVLLDLHP